MNFAVARSITVIEIEVISFSIQDFVLRLFSSTEICAILRKKQFTSATPILRSHPSLKWKGHSWYD